MKQNIKSLLPAALVVILSSSLIADSALAQASRAAKKEENTADQIGQQTGTVLQKASEMINANQMKQAREKLAELKLDKLSPHERAIVEQMNVQIDVAEEKFASARTHMQAAIDTGGLNDQEVAAGKYMIAQLFVQEEKWADGAKGLEDWLKTAAAKPNGSAYYLLAICYYQLDKVDQALPHAKKAVEISDKPQTPWVELYASLLMQKERFKEALPVVEKLVNGSPNKKNYWMMLSNIYGQLEDFKNALIVMQLANDAGLLTDGNEYQRLADLMMNQDMPYNAASVIQKAIDDKKINPDSKTWKYLGDAYVNAREYKKALPMLEKAAQAADKGTEYFQLGQVNMQLSQWDAAVSAFEKAISKGGLRDQHEANANIGMSLFFAKKYAEAKPYFEKIPASSNQSKTAKGFLQSINAQLKR